MIEVIIGAWVSLSAQLWKKFWINQVYIVTLFSLVWGALWFLLWPANQETLLESWGMIAGTATIIYNTLKIAKPKKKDLPWKNEV